MNGISGIFKNLKQAQLGLKVYKRLFYKYGEDYVICVNQHRAIGDAFLMSLYLPEYFANRKFVVTTIGKASAEVFEYMSIPDIEILTQAQSDALITFAQFSGIGENSVKILHHQALKWNIGIAWQLQGVNGLCFADMIEFLVFNGVDREKRRYPKRETENEKVRELFSKNGLRRSNTVILFPYTNTLAAPDAYFWNKVFYNKLKEKKDVCTCVYGNEKPVEGTVSISLGINELIYAAEYAGEIVCARNGLADILSLSRCRKTFVYPPGGSEGWIHGTLLDFWSLNRFGYCSDAIETTF